MKTNTSWHLSNYPPTKNFACPQAMVIGTKPKLMTLDKYGNNQDFNAKFQTST